MPISKVRRSISNVAKVPDGFIAFKDDKVELLMDLNHLYDKYIFVCRNNTPNSKQVSDFETTAMSISDDFVIPEQRCHRIFTA
jgi:hypothetical protein